MIFDLFWRKNYWQFLVLRGRRILGKYRIYDCGERGYVVITAYTGIIIGTTYSFVQAQNLAWEYTANKG